MLSEQRCKFYTSHSLSNFISFDQPMLDELLGASRIFLQNFGTADFACRCIVREIQRTTT